MPNNNKNNSKNNDDDEDGCRLRDLPRHRRSISQLIYNLGKFSFLFYLYLFLLF